MGNVIHYTLNCYGTVRGVNNSSPPSTPRRISSQASHWSPALRPSERSSTTNCSALAQQASGLPWWCYLVRSTAGSRDVLSQELKDGPGQPCTPGQGRSLLETVSYFPGVLFLCFFFFFATNLSIHSPFLNKEVFSVFLKLYSILIVEGLGDLFYNFWLFLLIMLIRNSTMKGTIFARL